MFPPRPWRGEGGCGPTAVEEVPVLPVPWCLCVCVPVCPFVPVSICLWVCAGGCPKTPLVSVRPFTSVLCENYNLTGERALFSRCTEWGLGLGLGLGLTDRSIPRRQFFTAPCGCGLQHRGPWGRSQKFGPTALRTGPAATVRLGNPKLGLLRLEKIT